MPWRDQASQVLQVLAPLGAEDIKMKILMMMRLGAALSVVSLLTACALGDSAPTPKQLDLGAGAMTSAPAGTSPGGGDGADADAADRSASRKRGLAFDRGDGGVASG